MAPCAWVWPFGRELFVGCWDPPSLHPQFHREASSSAAWGGWESRRGADPQVAPVSTCVLLVVDPPPPSPQSCGVHRAGLRPLRVRRALARPGRPRCMSGFLSSAGAQAGPAPGCWAPGAPGSRGLPPGLWPWPVGRASSGLEHGHWAVLPGRDLTSLRLGRAGRLLAGWCLFLQKLAAQSHGAFLLQPRGVERELLPASVGWSVVGASPRLFCTQGERPSKTEGP